MKGLVSIIIPVYNRANIISKTLESIISQKYTNWECLVIDDSSTDNIKEVVNSFINYDSRIQFFKKPSHLPKGPSAARNFGFEKSKGEYINWFDSDDIMKPCKLSKDLSYINRGSYDFTISQSEFFTDTATCSKKFWNKKLLSEDSINDFITGRIGWGVNSPLWRRKSLLKSNLIFDEDLLTADDYFYHLQALIKNLKPVCINEVLVRLRVHEERLSNKMNKAPYKLKVNLYLIKHKHKFDLSIVTLNFLNKQYHNQYVALLKHKQIRLALYYLVHSHHYGFKLRLKIKFYYLFVMGLFYYISGYGYDYFKKI